MARPPGPAIGRPEDMLHDRATQPARVRALIEYVIAWMARFCGP
jgi:hypothetical protein